MTKQDRIDKLKNAIAALDNQISQVQSALNSPGTTADQVLALRSALIELQAQRSALMSALIDLQASEARVDALEAGPSAAQDREVQALHDDLKASITDQTIVKTTLTQANSVKENVSRMQALLMAPKAKKRSR